MTYFMAMVLGLVQGVAEFLPISSSGHLTLLQYFFGLEEVDSLYNILLHFATLLAVCVAYCRDIGAMIAEFFRGVAALAGRREEQTVPPARRLVLLVVLATLPLFFIVPLEGYIEGLGSQPMFVAVMLLVTGCLLFFSDRMAQGTKTERSATLRDALLVGLAQGLATVPGLSRSGTTISAGMALGLERSFAVRFSFLLSLPAVLGATLLKVLKVLGEGGLHTERLPMYLLGMAVAAVVGYGSIRLVHLLASKGRFGAFAYYCWAAGAAAIVALMLGV